jgi:predicted TIM-barrel fold metal-dependent hydrolase
VRGTLKDNPLVKLMDELNVSEEDKANILGNNAVKLFRL